MQPKINLLTDKIYPSLIRFVTPLLLMWLQTSLFGIIDLMIISNYTDAFAVDAVAGGISVMNVITYTIAALTTGGGILIGQQLGAKRHEDAKKIMGNMYVLFGVIALVVSVVMVALAAPIATWLNLEGQSWTDGFNYLIIAAAGIPFIMGFNVIAAQLRAFGNSKSPFLFLVLAASVNIILDLVFVGLLGMRASGAALASIISQVSSFSAALIYLRIKNFPLHMTWKDIHFDKEWAKKTLKTGLPLAVQDGIALLSFTIVISLVNLYETGAGSGFGISEKIIYLCFVPLNAFGSALTVTTAQNLGAKQLDRTIQYAKAGLIIEGALVAILVTISEIFAPQIATLFTDDPIIISYAVSFIRVVALDAVFGVFVYILTALFMGSGHTTFSMLQSVLSTVLVRIPLALVFVYVFHASSDLLAWSYPLASAFSLILCLVYFRTGRWKRISDESVASSKQTN